MRVLAEQNRAFGYAIAASLALHALVLAVRVPALRQTEPATSEAPLVARLVERGAPAPAAPATLPAPPPAAQKPEPAKPAVRAPPAAPKRKRVAEPKPLVKSAPRASPPVTPPAERQAEDAHREEAAPGPAAPAPEAAPPVSAPTGVSVAPPANPDPKAERDRFRQEVIEKAERIKRYPKRAVDEGWAGQVTVRIEIADNGSVASVRVKASSGNSLLDAVAVEIVSKAAAQVAVPPALRGKAFSVEVPAIYKFTD